MMQSGVATGPRRLRQNRLADEVLHQTLRMEAYCGPPYLPAGLRVASAWRPHVRLFAMGERIRMRH